MNSLVFYCSFLSQLYISDSLSGNDKTADELNNRPIIGIPTMKITDRLLQKNIPKLAGKSYIAASYVKFVEMAGGRVVPIPSNLNYNKLKFLFNSVNAILFPGGEVNLENSGYFNNTKKLYDMAIEANQQGDWFPILGICRGMQAILVHTEGDLTPLTETDSRNYSTNVKWFDAAFKSTLLKNIPDWLLEDAEQYNITSHFHKYGVTPNNFKQISSIEKKFKILATSYDRNGTEFVSVFEGLKLPFYGIQFHPEKTMFEWAESMNIPHSSNAVRLAQYMGDNFIDEARKNTKHRFKNSKEERTFIVSKKSPFYMGFLTESHSPFSQIYVF